MSDLPTKKQEPKNKVRASAKWHLIWRKWLGKQEHDRASKVDMGTMQPDYVNDDLDWTKYIAWYSRNTIDNREWKTMKLDEFYL